MKSYILLLSYINEILMRKSSTDLQSAAAFLFNSLYCHPAACCNLDACCACFSSSMEYSIYCLQRPECCSCNKMLTLSIISCSITSCREISRMIFHIDYENYTIY